MALRPEKARGPGLPAAPLRGWEWLARPGRGGLAEQRAAAWGRVPGPSRGAHAREWAGVPFCRHETKAQSGGDFILVLTYFSI